MTLSPREAPAKIRAWLGRAASEYTYPSELAAVRHDDADHWTAVRP